MKLSERITTIARRAGFTPRQSGYDDLLRFVKAEKEVGVLIRENHLFVSLHVSGKAVDRKLFDGDNQIDATLAYIATL